MKINNFFFLVIMGLLSCQNNPADSSSEDEGSYNCEVTKAQFQSVDSLVTVMNDLDPWGSDTVLDSIATLNDSIEKRLTNLLQCGAVETLDINSETFDNLYYAQTPDGRIRNFHWYANNGGTWQEMRRIYQYYPKPKQAKTTTVDYFAGATRFFQLKSEEPMYLGMGIDKTCSTCLVEYADLFSFQADTLKIDNVASLESRMGDLISFDFDSTTQTLHYVMIVDDMNEDWAVDKPKQKFKDLNIELGDEYEGYEPDPNSDVVMGSLVFNGKAFVEK
jgi:hypothetical protein